MGFLIVEAKVIGTKMVVNFLMFTFINYWYNNNCLLLMLAFISYCYNNVLFLMFSFLSYWCNTCCLFPNVFLHW